MSPWLQRIRTIFLALAGVFVLAAGLGIGFHRQIIAHLAEAYGYRLDAQDLALDTKGGQLRRLVASAGYVLEDISWRWQSEGAPLFPFRPDIHINHVIMPTQPDQKGETKIDPVALRGVLRDLTLPAGQVVIDRLELASGWLALTVKSPGGNHFVLKIPDMSVSFGDIKMSGGVDIDWDGQDLKCAGTVLVHMKAPVAGIGDVIEVKPVCENGDNPAVNATMIARNAPKKDQVLWQQMRVHIPMRQDALDHIDFTLEKSPILPPVLGKIAAGDMQGQGVHITTRPIKSTVLEQPLSLSPLDLRWKGNIIRMAAIDIGWGTEGRVQITPLELRISDLLTQGKITLNQINPAPILARWPIKGLYFEGIFNGDIPFETSNGIITLKDGLLTADEGIVRYVPESPAADNLAESGGGIALAAMGDFHYDDLKIALNGIQSGDQTVQMTLSGRNPALYDGYPVVMRVNLSGALEELFRQGQATMSLPERLKLEHKKQSRQPLQGTQKP